MLRYGLTSTEWSIAKAETLKILQGRAATRSMIPYSDLAREIKSTKFEPHEPALWALIGEISEEEVRSGRGMLSALVVHKHGDLEPGSGFYELAAELGRDMSDREKGWIGEVLAVFDYWSNRRKPVT